MIGKKPGSSARGVPHDHHIYLHGEDVVHRVNQRFAFRNGRTGGREVNNVCAKSLFSEFEGDSCAGRVFEKYVGYRSVPQGGHFLYRSLQYLLKIICRAEYGFYILRVQFLNA